MDLVKECIPCIKKQAQRVIELSTDVPTEQTRIFDVVSTIIDAHKNTCIVSPELARKVYAAIAKETNIEDPYTQIKQDSNHKMLSLCDKLHSWLNVQNSTLSAGLHLAAVGNIIDYGIFGYDFDIMDILDKIETEDFAIDDSDIFAQKLHNANSLLYILDNAGEIVMDKIFIETLQKLYPNLKITAVVRGGAIINDVTIADAKTVGLDKVVDVIDTGSKLPGIPQQGSAIFEKAIHDSDVVIAKGQGNFETEREDYSVFHLFKVKCDVLSEYISIPMGKSVFCLRGENV